MKLILTFLFLPIISWAESDHQTWNSFTVKSRSNKIDFGVEVENRTSESGSLKNINQIKPELFCNLPKGRLGFIYTLESGNSFKEKTENRYSVAYDFSLYTNALLIVETRFRQEFRNFADQDDLAYRFRFRNTFTLNKKRRWSFRPWLSSEWRIYEKNSAGKSFENFSHRAVVGLTKQFKRYTVRLHYTHNFQKEDEADQNTHAFGLNLSIQI